jgi:glycerol-3-phosphate O-acyltransferase
VPADGRKRRSGGGRVSSISDALHQFATGTIALPVWLVVVAGTLGVVGLIDRLLLPSVRWALKRRAISAIEDLNTRLKLRLPPFKLGRRSALIDQLRYDPDVLAAVEAYVKETGTPRDVANDKVRRYAEEIVPGFSAYTYFRVGTRLARRLSRALYRVRLGYYNEPALAAVDPNASVVFVINHRSNMDYVLVTYLASTAAALSYAVGEWAQIWPLRTLIRAMGGYFIRRNSGDPLYRRVVARYVAMATHAGVVQAVFPEGGLSRDGTLRPPKLGLIAYMVHGFDPKGARDIVFVPVGLNYDRVLEDRNLTAAAALAPGQEPVFRFNPMVFVKYIASLTGRALTGRLYKNGYACVSFGEPLSLAAYCTANRVDFRVLDGPERQSAVDRFGRDLMSAVGRVVPALPVSLVSTALLEAGPGALSSFELKGRVYALISQLEQRKAHVHIPRADRGYAIDVGLRMLAMRHLVLVDGDTYTANPAETPILRYYANAIAHLVK